MLSPFRLRWLSLLLAILGFSCSAYLLYRSFILLGGGASDSTDICSIVFGADCDATLMDQATWVLGIPLAGWGVVYYVTLLALLIMALFLRDAFSPQAMLAALLLSLAGLTNSVVLSISMIWGVSPLCPLCLIVHAVNALLVPLVFAATGRRIRELLREFRAGMAYIVGRRAEEPREAAWRVIGFVTVALVAIVAYQWVYVQVVLRQKMAEQEEYSGDPLAEFLSHEAGDIPLSAEDIRRGPADAAATLVVFSDFQCPHCARSANSIRDLQDRYASEMAIVFKHFPLSSACNPTLKTDLHPRSCALAVAAEAAHRQGKFWAFHDEAFASKDTDFDDATIENLAAEAGLDMPKFAADRNSESVREKVQADITLGLKLGVRGRAIASKS